MLRGVVVCEADAGIGAFKGGEVGGREEVAERCLGKRAGTMQGVSVSFSESVILRRGCASCRGTYCKAKAKPTINPANSSVRSNTRSRDALVSPDAPALVLPLGDSRL